jgi:ubiquinone/menaquinone biosynthesis C-methylase UbiE/uncharacterized protein YbaR (Trm112 family)
MQQRLLQYLSDPYTGEDIELFPSVIEGDEIITGVLKSASNTYSISNGIPRFVPDESYSKNFGWQWKKWSKVQFDDENIDKPMMNYTKEMFDAITLLDNQSLEGSVILDMGCGSGRFADIALSKGAIVIALDYSTAVDVAQVNLPHKNLMLIQGDALNLPLKENSIDFCYSIGVLHHTPSPQTGVSEAYKVLKEDGTFALSVYSKGSLYDFSGVHIWRKIFKFTWRYLKHYPPLWYSVFFGGLCHFIGKINTRLTYPIRFFFPTMVLPDLKWSILDTFDSVTTSYQSAHNIHEVTEWFEEIKFKEITVGNWGVNLLGKK